jgi:hypothetical protein
MYQAHTVHNQLGKGILFHTVGARWYTQQFNVMLSLSRMPDSAVTHPKCEGVVHAQVPSMAA